MSNWNPVWKVFIDGNSKNYANTTISNLTITSGRTTIDQQAQAGYCNIQLLNLSNEAFNFNVTDSLTIQLQNSSGTYVNIFGGFITDFNIEVIQAGATGFTTAANITAVGALSRLSKSTWTDTLSQDEDGDQIYTLLVDLLINAWDEVAPALTWAAYNPATTWANAENVGLGEIDRPGKYICQSRPSSADVVDRYSLASLIAQSALGQLYEDGSGRICYADATHRQDYLANNGYTELSANDAYAAGLRTITQSGDIRNDITLNYGAGFGSQKTASDTASIATYGKYAESINTVIHGATDAQLVADRRLSLKAYPRAKFDSITFPLTNNEIDNADRDALIGIFMGLPIKITNLPNNISDGTFEGYVEGFTFRAGYNRVDLTINATPIEFSQVAVRWDQVSGSEAWNTLSGILTWNNAIGAVA
jgi:hypothetical protein